MHLQVNLEKVQASIGGDPVSLDTALTTMNNLLLRRRYVHLMGNGGSAAICDHIAVDYCKYLGLCARSLTNPATLTCIANDYGYERVFSQQIAWYSVGGEAAIIVSSSGESRNVVNAAKVCKDFGIPIVALTAFKPNNTLRQFGYISFYYPTHLYSEAEVAHLSILHSLVQL
jgi:D-sedoheptulose 7-phosphate isomerase